MSKTIAVLGATGSVGLQALDVASKQGVRVDFISANKDVVCAERIAREHHPRAVAMADECSAKELKARLADTDITVLSGEGGICEGISLSDATVVVNSILGKAGLIPSLAVIDSGKRLALANKESLVIAGDIVMGSAKEKGVEIIPVDSEHSAIFQSLRSGDPSEIRRIFLTASGGPFFGYTKEQLAAVTLEDTLRHPTWKMGKKITVDSATLMNKGFEVIEAAHLFGVEPSRIKVLVHRESILHSAVEYIDNSVIGEMSVPDMRMCVQYALDYPLRKKGVGAPLDLVGVGKLTFFDVDTEAFPLLPLAARGYRDGGTMCAVINAADEVAVEAFLTEKIGFAHISEAIADTYEKMTHMKDATSLEDILAADEEARRVAIDTIRKYSGVKN